MKTKVRCAICPKGCELASSETGGCLVRKNIGGTIVCTTYALPCAVNIDPIEKKPLYHVLPGNPILSIATPGCNLHCAQCQNWQISQAEHVSRGHDELLPGDVVRMANKHNCRAIAYTYTEPLVSFEYTRDCCEAAAEADIKNVLVTAAYVNPDPLRQIGRFVAAANVDLKSFSDAFYRDVCDARLAPVLKALTIMKECGIWLEITNLVIPTLNDDEAETRQLCRWIAENLGVETPLHFSRFFPQHKLKHLPPTPEKTLLRVRGIALETGLKFVYTGNMRSEDGENTNCPQCGKLLIERHGYTIHQNHLENGRCPACAGAIPGIWE